MPDFAARRLTMVDTQIRPADVTKYAVIAAFLAVPREVFVPDSLRMAAYVGDNLPLGPGRVLLEPRTLGKMLDALDIGPDSLVLDVGAGLGYSSAVIAQLAQMVIALEEPALAPAAETALATMAIDNLVLEAGELAAGTPQHAPYDVIVLQGGVEEVPAALLDQLRIGGRIGGLFMDGELGTARIGTRTAAGMVWRDIFNAAAPVLPGFSRMAEFAL